MWRMLLFIASLLIQPTRTEAIGDMGICYILDGILIVYGVVLTILYCRLRMVSADKKAQNTPQKQPAEGGIYAGLTSRSNDTYETIKIDKRPIA